MKVDEFNWYTTNEKEIKEMLDNVEYSELEDLGIDNEEERDSYLEALKDMLEKAQHEYDEWDYLDDTEDEWKEELEK